MTLSFLSFSYLQPYMSHQKCFVRALESLGIIFFYKDCHEPPLTHFWLTAPPFCDLSLTQAWNFPLSAWSHTCGKAIHSSWVGVPIPSETQRGIAYGWDSPSLRHLEVSKATAQVIWWGLVNVNKPCWRDIRWKAHDRIDAFNWQGLCTFLLAPMWSSWAFNKSSATECGGKERLSCVGNKKENLWLLKVGLLKSPNCKSRLPVCRQCRPILKSHWTVSWELQ